MSQASLPSMDVVVPVLDAALHLPRVLDPLEEAQRRGSLRSILVVDDGSTDGGDAVCARRGHRVLRTPAPRSGPAAARNLGATVADAEWILFVDADVVIPADLPGRWRDRLLGRDDVVAVFGSYDDAPDAPGHWSRCRNLLHHWFHQRAPEEASTFWAGCGAVRRDILEAVGGFDASRYPRPSIEDIELGSRLRARGRILLWAEGTCKHLKRWTPGTTLRTDFACRALPWVRLLRERPDLPRALNAAGSERRKALWTVGMLLAAVSLPWTRALGAAGLLVLLVLAAFEDRAFLRFVGARLGAAGVLVGFVMLRGYYASAAAAWLVGNLLPLSRRPGPASSTRC